MDIEELYLDLLNEQTDERISRIENDPKEAEKFMAEVMDEYASRCDRIHDEWKDRQLKTYD